MTKNNRSAWLGMTFHQIAMQQAMQSINEPVYCRYCGKDIKQPSKESSFSAGKLNTGNYADEWEVKNNAHYNCYKRNYTGR
ncbi:hypothetical protein P4I85_14640 [Bacillus cereus]|uniref:hypothetical protein n=1 Tax=Bacillus thuringiensis TaxID=1428 RepID=UPI001298CD00|nr:hypothetical protein [Bacillus thuringiensis]MEB9509633.1 hypothetical protein [Bacillus cereus]MEB9561725.1 hypothetical protein [Bacillus cereus]MRC03043.1 hypothetical protein [Bacillus thuringiensis]